VNDHLTHLIQNPVSIRIEENDAGADAMQIEAADGTQTIVTLTPPD
jgi:hypothetical protein